MSADRVFTTFSPFAGLHRVRYGSASSFDWLGNVEKVGNLDWWATSADGRDLGNFTTKREAISAVVVEARL